MEPKKLRELFEFAKDENRVNAAFDSVIKGIESGDLNLNDLPLPAAPIKPGAVSEPEQEYIAELMEQYAATPLDAIQKAELRRVIRELPVDSTMAELKIELSRNPNLGPLGAALP